MILEETLRKLREVERGKWPMERDVAKDAADAIELLLSEVRILKPRKGEAGR